MYYIDQQSLPSLNPNNKTTISILINTLTLSPQSRTLSDHQFVYQFFYDNKILCDVERLKSYNAKQQCIVELMADTKVPGGNEGNGDGKNGVGEGQGLGNNEGNGKVMIIDKIVVTEPNPSHQKSKNKKPNPKKSQSQPQFLQTTYYIYIPTAKYLTILSTDDKHLRQKLQRLKKYMILKDMKYNQLLHLAYYMDQIQSKYKEEVYKEGEEARFLYLVEMGEFHYSKVWVEEGDGDVKGINGHGPVLKKGKKKDRPKRYNATHSNPNRLHHSKSTQLKIGLIQGQCGQSFGQSQIISSKPREYTVKCMSTENLLIRIPAEKYQRVLNTSVTKMEWVRKENQRKLELKEEMMNRMILVKNSYKKYAELISKDSLNKTQNIRVGGEPQLNDDINLHNNPTNNGSQVRPGISGKLGLPRIKSQSMASEQHSRITTKGRDASYSRVQGQTITIQNQSSIPHHIRKSYQSEQSQGDGTFALTKTSPKAPRHTRHRPQLQLQRDNISLHLPMSTKGSNATLLPSIMSDNHKNTKKHVSAYESMETGSIGKNWSATRPILQLRGLRNKFSGMIDANSLIKQKQQIFNIKNSGKQANKEIYSLDLSNPKIPKSLITPITTKQQSREMRSAVHSKFFMQKLLVEALKKAGYNAQTGNQKNRQNRQNYVEDDKPDSIIDIKNNLRIPKIKSKIKMEKFETTGLLQENQFDQCYFRKME